MITYSEMSFQKVCMIIVIRRNSNTSCLGQYWITRQMGMPYRWQIKMWLYVGDVEPLLTANILRNNRQQVHSSTDRAFTPYELVNHDEIKACDEFETAIGEKLGPAVSAEDFESDLDIFIPTLDRYEDEEEYQTNMPEADDITPEAMDNYIGVDIMISHGDTVA